MATVALGTVLVALDISLPSIALPTMAKTLGILPSSAVQLVMVYQLVLVMTLLPMAAVGERWGYRTVYIAGLGLFVVGGVLCYFAPSFPLLLVARGIQALGASAITAITTALIRGIFSDAHLGKALAAHSVVVSTANAFAPALGGLIVSLFDWRFVFIVGTPFAIGVILCSSVLPASIRRAIPFDWASALLCALAFGLVVGGLEVMVHGGGVALGAAVLAVGAVAAVVFVRRELSQSEPILPLDLLRRRVLALSLLGSFLCFNAAMIITVTMPFRLANEFGYSAGVIGTMMAPWPLMIMVAAPLAAILSDKMEPALLGGMGMAVSVVGVLTLFFLPAQPDWWDVAWRMGLSGVGFAFYTAPNARLILKSAPRHRTASAGGLTSTTRLTGQVLGATLAAGLLAFGTSGSQWAPLVAATMCLVAGVTSFARGRVRDEPGR